MSEYLAQIRHAHIFSGLSDDELSSLLDCIEPQAKQYAKESYLLRSGEATGSIGLVLSGSVLVLQDDFWGNRNIMARILPGQIFAEVFACSPGSLLNVSVVAAEDCAVMWLNISKILTVCPKACSKHSHIIHNLLADMAAKTLRLNEKVSHMAHRSTRQKLLSYLWAEAVKAGQNHITIPFNRQQLADYLAVDRSAMSNELSKLRKEGYISFTHNNFVLLSIQKN